MIKPSQVSNNPRALQPDNQVLSFFAMAGITPEACRKATAEFCAIVKEQKEAAAQEYWQAIKSPAFADYAPEYKGRPSGKEMLLGLMLPASDRASKERAKTRVWIRSATLIAALRLYHMENDRYPDNLDALVPTHLEKLPGDPFSGKPFGYISDADGRAIYSVGPDMRDDAGKIAYDWNRQGPSADKGDWVFRLP